MKPSCSSRPRPGRFLAALVAAVPLLLLGCEGGNAWEDVLGPGGGGSPTDAVRDTIPPGDTRILLPLPGAVVAVGDSLRVHVSAQDETALASITVEAFTLDGGQRAELYDSVFIAYPATDTVRTDTVVAVLGSRGDVAADAAFVVARSRDRAGNVRADTVQISIAVIRGAQIALDNQVDRIVDLVSDGRRLFVSNYSRNRVEVIDLATNARSSIQVGSQPWGLAISPDSSTLFVANSGGTNISVVDLATAGTPQENVARRISTPNAKLFRVPFSRDSVEIVNDAGAKVKISALVPASVTEYDYSDRPQFIAQTVGGSILYSTKPTRTAADGTIRWRRPDGHIEIFLGYARRNVPGSLVIMNALDAGLVEADPAKKVYVLDAEGVAHIDYLDVVEQELLASGSRTRFEYYVNIEDVGLQDTTFVAVSGNHRSVAFGEGAADPGRIMFFQELASDLIVETGDTDDLLGNAAEPVVGLTLNQDGSLGAARGENAYFFTPDLRLQGVGITGVPAGGISLHPWHRGYQSGTTVGEPEGVAFVTGRDENGSPYVDVLDTFTFFRRERIFLREAITGPVLTVRAPAGSGAALQLYGITATGLLRLDLVTADLQR